MKQSLLSLLLHMYCTCILKKTHHGQLQHSAVHPLQKTQASSCLCLRFKLPPGNEEALTCGKLTAIHWTGWMRSASSHQQPPLSSRLHCPHCHPKSDTHKRKAFNWVYSWALLSPTAHDYWNSQPLVFSTQGAVHTSRVLVISVQ